MSVFMLETEAVSSAASSINSLANEVSNLSSSVSGYDTACEDGFDFAGAKSVIASNLEACATKIQNTSKLMENVVNSHTQLQNSLVFEDPNKAKSSEEDTNGKNGSQNDDNNYYDGGGTYDSGGSWNGGGSAVALAAQSEEEEEDKEDDKKEDKTGEVKTKLEKVGYAYADEDNLDDDSKELFKDKEFEYDEDGYAKIGDRYVIACDESVGNIGDVVRFTQKEGDPIECVIGVNTHSDKYKGTVNFLVDKKAEKIVATDTTKNLIDNTTKVENMGDLETVRKFDELKKKMESSSTSTTGSNTGSNGTTGSDSSTSTAESNTGSNSTTGSDSSTSTTGDSNNQSSSNNENDSSDKNLVQV